MYHVELKHETLGWREISDTAGNGRAYCEGYVDCLDAHYPSHPARVVKTETDGSTTVVRETKGRGAVHTNFEKGSYRTPRIVDNPEE